MPATPLPVSEANLSKAKKSACWPFSVRALVSKKKRRYIGDGVDLDLTYVTDRLIAMGYPSVGLEALYRNPASVVRRFLEQRHAGNYRIWNLCIERDYARGSFPAEIERYTWYDHTPPPLALVSEGAPACLSQRLLACHFCSMRARLTALLPVYSTPTTVADATCM